MVYWYIMSQSAIILGSLSSARRPLRLIYNKPISILPHSYLYNIIINHIIICQVQLLVYNHRIDK